MASILVAEGEPMAELLLLGFPLHPPKRPGTVRAAHLARVTVPMPLVQGTRLGFDGRSLADHTQRRTAPVPADRRAGYSFTSLAR